MLATVKPINETVPIWTYWVSADSPVKSPNPNDAVVTESRGDASVGRKLDSGVNPVRSASSARSILNYRLCLISSSALSVDLLAWRS